MSLFLACALLIPGCTEPYSTPRIEQFAPNWQPATPFPGITGLLSPNTTLHVLWTHGICTHGSDWVHSRVSLIAGAIGTTAVAIGDPVFLAGGLAYTQTAEFAAPHGKFDVTFIVWSPLTRQYKDQLKFDASGQNPETSFVYERAKLSGDLKTTLVNDCLADAVVYLGPNGDPIRDAMDHAVCAALGGSFDKTQCVLPTAPDSDRRMFVAESIGSKFLFDAVRRLTDERYVAPAASAALMQRLASLQALYLVANQIPLLDQATAEGQNGSFHSSLQEFLELRDDAQKAFGGIEELPVVAFTDPNDLLSYRLLPRYIGATKNRIVNVIVSNEWTLIGYVERPDYAHCGYSWNAYVFGLIAHGYDGTLPVAPTSSVNKSCLGP